MKTEWAILGGALVIAAAVMVTDHWQMAVTPAGGMFRLNRWTGEVSVCVLREDTLSPAPGRFVDGCKN